MKTPALTSAISVAILSLTTALGFAQEVAKEVAKEVAFQTPGQTYIINGRNGAVVTSGKTAAAFKITDVNGGELADGDTVRISTTAGSKTGQESYWSETPEGAITRIRKVTPATSFIVKIKDGSLTLKTASGKFVGAKASDLGTTDQESAALVLKIVPAPAAAPKAPAAETPAE